MFFLRLKCLTEQKHRLFSALKYELVYEWENAFKRLHKCFLAHLLEFSFLQHKTNKEANRNCNFSKTPVPFLLLHTLVWLGEVPIELYHTHASLIFLQTFFPFFRKPTLSCRLCQILRNMKNLEWFLHVRVKTDCDMEDFLRVGISKSSGSYVFLLTKKKQAK